MAEITNTTDNLIPLHDGAAVAPRQTVTVDNWDEIKDKPQLAHYIDSGALVVGAKAKKAAEDKAK